MYIQGVYSARYTSYSRIFFMPIKKVQRLVEQGSNGSPAYEFATKIARAKDRMAIGTVVVGNTPRRVSQWCNPSKAPPPNFITQRRSARLSVSKGAGDAMIRHPYYCEMKDEYTTGQDRGEARSYFNDAWYTKAKHDNTFAAA